MERLSGSIERVKAEGGEAVSLYRAAKQNDKRLAAHLLRSGAKLDMRDEIGATPLHYAVAHGASDVAIELLNRNADARAINDSGYTPLMLHYLPGQERLQNSALALLVKRDGGFSERLLDFRLLGHRFSIKAHLFHGLPPEITFRELAEGLEEYGEQGADRNHLLELVPVLQRAIDHSIAPGEYALRIRRGEMVALSTGWWRHSTSVAFYGEWMATANRGDRQRMKPGIAIYRIRDLGVLEELVGRLIEPGRSSDHHRIDLAQEQMAFFDEGLCELVGGSQLSLSLQSSIQATALGSLQNSPSERFCC